MTVGGVVGACAGHAVTFYERDEDLVGELAGFVGGGIAIGDRVMVVATADHTRQLRELLQGQGFDLDEPATARRLIWWDAQETLDRFLLDGHLSADRFATVVGDRLDDALVDGSPVRVFGEVVALLWDRGDLLGAIELESWWNALATSREFSLLCAYRLDSVEAAPWPLMQGICREHDAVSPRPSGSTDQRVQLFLGVPAAVCSVRRFVADVVGEWASGAVVQDAVLVASELATNAVRHAGSPYRVSLLRNGSVIRIGVEDGNALRPTIGHPACDAIEGRGVRIIDAICTAWGTQTTGDGKLVWAELGARASGSG